MHGTHWRIKAIALDLQGRQQNIIKRTSRRRKQHTQKEVAWRISTVIIGCRLQRIEYYTVFQSTQLDVVKGVIHFRDERC